MGILQTVILFLLTLIVTFLNIIRFLISPILKFFGSSYIPSVVRTPEERFEGLDKLGYNFNPNYLSIDAGCGVTYPRVHYVDEGPRQAPVILCLHGEPAWSFLYRKMVGPLVTAGYRVIVPDMIGFGKSDKYTNYENYNHELHTMVVRKLLDHCKVTGNITLVCQDWGGLTGLSVVKDVPNMFSALVIMNTGLPAPIFNFADTEDGKEGAMAPLAKMASILPFILWQTSVGLLRNNLPVHRLFNMMLKNVEPEITAAYNAPFPSNLYKAGAGTWPLFVPAFKDDPVTYHMKAARNCLKTWRKPALVMFSDSDPITRGSKQLFLNLLPDCKDVVVKGAGHFLQETHGPELAESIISFLKEKHD